MCYFHIRYSLSPPRPGTPVAAGPETFTFDHDVADLAEPASVVVEGTASDQVGKRDHLVGNGPTGASSSYLRILVAQSM